MKRTILSILLTIGAIASLSAQNARTLSGKVTDSSGEPLMGAGVVVNSQEGLATITDLDGNYTLSGLKFPAKVTVSFVGYSDLVLNLTGEETSPYNIKFSEDQNLLEEVVVVGFGTQKKSTLSGSVGVVDGSTLNLRPVVSAANALQGADPSVYISSSNGSPNSSVSINIRGTLSINGGSPLVLVDGVEGDLTMVNPNDIESVSILKDASTCAIYGAKASVGVVLVNTKQGSSQKAQVTYGYRHGWISPTTSTDYITCGYDHISIVNYFQQHSFTSSRANEFDYTAANGELLKLYERRNDVTEDPSRPWVEAGADGRWHYYGNFDWYNYFINTNRPTNEHDLSVSGGNKDVKYYIGARYYNEDGLMKGNLSDDFNNYSIRSKITANITKHIKYSNNISYSKKNYAWQGNSNQEATLLNLWRNSSPAFSPFNPDGTVVHSPIEVENGNNKVAFMGNYATQALSGKNHNSKDVANFTMTNKIDINFGKNVTLTGQYDYRRIDELFKYRTGKYSYSRYVGVLEEMTGTTDSYQEARNYRNVHIGTVTAQYENNWGGHYFKALLGGQYENSYTSDLSVKGSPIMVDGYDSLALVDQSSNDDGTKKASYEVGADATGYKTLGFFGRLNYDWKGRYIVEFSARYDGTSRFSEKHRWGFFPSASIAWKFSDENWFKPIDSWFNNGKLRFSAGSLGNQQVSNYYYMQKITTDNTADWTFDGSTKARQATISAPVSSSLTWETVNTYDWGIDLGFLNNRLGVVADYYIRDTKNMLTASASLPEVFGATEPKENCADLRTKGWEFSISWKDSFNLAGKPFSYGITGFLGDRRTVITRFDNPTGKIDDYYVGKELGEIWGFRSGGLFKTDQEAAEYTAAHDSREYQMGYYGSGGVCIDGPGAKAGDFKLLDIAGAYDIDGKSIPDGKIDKGAGTLDDHGDLVVIGNSQAHFNYSFRIDMDWAGIDLSLFFQGVGRKDWFPNGAYGGYAFWGPYSASGVTFIHKKFMNNVWSEDNQSAYFPRPRGYSAYSSSDSDRWTGLGITNDYFLQNIGYLRLKNLTLGYTLPQNLTSRIYIQKLRFYVSGENLFYASPLKAHNLTIDPELASASGVATSNTGVGYLYPRTITVGATITF